MKDLIEELLECASGQSSRRADGSLLRRAALALRSTLPDGKDRGFSPSQPCGEASADAEVFAGHDAELSGARSRLRELSDNLRALNAGFALGAVYGEFPFPEVTLAGDLRAMLHADLIDRCEFCDAPFDAEPGRDLCDFCSEKSALSNPPGEKGSISSVADSGSTAIEPKSDSDGGH